MKSTCFKESEETVMILQRNHSACRIMLCLVLVCGATLSAPALAQDATDELGEGTDIKPAEEPAKPAEEAPPPPAVPAPPVASAPPAAPASDASAASAPNVFFGVEIL